MKAVVYEKEGMCIVCMHLQWRGIKDDMKQ
jgi:hypothetical protein